MRPKRPFWKHDTPNMRPIIEGSNASSGSTATLQSGTKKRLEMAMFKRKTFTRTILEGILGKGCDEALCSEKKGFSVKRAEAIQWMGGLVRFFYRKGNSVKRSVRFSELPDSENWKVAVLISPSRKSALNNSRGNFETVPWNRRPPQKSSIEPSRRSYRTRRKVLSNSKRFYRPPFWAPKRFHRTLVRGTSEPQTGFYRTFSHRTPGFETKRARKLTRTSLRTSPWNFNTIFSEPPGS